MSYTGDQGKIDAQLRRRDETPTIGHSMRNRLVATGDLTDGRFGLFECSLPGGQKGPAPHFHRTFSESFYVLSGTVRVYDGDNWHNATVGDFLLVPEGGIHAFDNAGDEPASMLILFAPGAPREQYFAELDELRRSKRTLDPDEWAAFYARHDQYMV